MERSLIPVRRLAAAAALPLLSGLNIAVAQTDTAALDSGRELYATYCAPCHGAAGAGLVGPNLTDAEVLHGESHEDIVRVITEGISGKAMPAWDAVLNADQIGDVAAFVRSIMGTNLPSPLATVDSIVTPFPMGTRAAPLVLRTFMPTLEMGDEVFTHHHLGQATPKYQPNNGRFSGDEVDAPIDGIPAAIAVNFGPELSYCFDTTECRLLYTWSGGFMDMTDYWGAETGGARKRFSYVPTLMGSVAFKARGFAPVRGTPRFLGYQKIDGVPAMRYRVGVIEFLLRIEPGDTPGVAICHYTTEGADSGLIFRLPPGQAERCETSVGEFVDGELHLDAAAARAFTLTLRPEVSP